MTAARPWYKRYPSDFIASTVKMTAEEKGVYSTIIDHMYDRGGPIADEPAELARLCGCSTRRFNQIKRQLIEKHQKIVIEDGMIIQPRTIRQISAETDEHEKFARNGSKGGEKSAEIRRKTKDKAPEKLTTHNHSNGLAENGLATSERYVRAVLPLPESSPPTPPSGVSDVDQTERDWWQFVERWERSDTKANGVIDQFCALDPPDRKTAIAGVRPFRAEEKSTKHGPLSARRYLAERRWEGLKQAPAPADTGPSLGGVLIVPGTAQWQAWKTDYTAKAAAGDVDARSNLAVMRAREESNRPYRVPCELPPAIAEAGP